MQQLIHQLLDKIDHPSELSLNCEELRNKVTKLIEEATDENAAIGIDLEELQLLTASKRVTLQKLTALNWKSPEDLLSQLTKQMKDFNNADIVLLLNRCYQDISLLDINILTEGLLSDLNSEAMTLFSVQLTEQSEPYLEIWVFAGFN